MNQRKHKFLVTITFDEPLSERRAKANLNQMIAHAKPQSVDPITTWTAKSLMRYLHGMVTHGKLKSIGPKIFDAFQL